MKPILLLGGGGHCRSCIDVIESTGDYRIVGIVQPQVEGQQPVLGYPIVGSDDDLPRLLADTPYALITVGQIKTPAIRIRLFERLIQHQAQLPRIVSAHAYCSRHAQIGAGTIVMHGALINANAVVGDNVIINSHALIEHDVQIGSHCHIATGARINGSTQIGTGCFIGSGAIVRQDVHIGAGSIIAAGQVVLNDVPPDTRIYAKR